MARLLTISLDGLNEGLRISLQLNKYRNAEGGSVASARVTLGREVLAFLVRPPLITMVMTRGLPCVNLQFMPYSLRRHAGRYSGHAGVAALHMTCVPVRQVEDVLPKLLERRRKLDAEAAAAEALEAAALAAALAALDAKEALERRGVKRRIADELH